MKRRRVSIHDDDSSSSSAPASAFAPPQIINKSSVNFALGPINQHYTCRLCDGYFRDPITITECLHTFCKSCLYYAFSSAFTRCPTCDVELGPDPIKSTLHDRTKEELMDRVLFPELSYQDDQLERRFYAQRGIAMKAEYQQLEQKKRLAHELVAQIEGDHQIIAEGADLGEEVDLKLLPMNSSVPSIPYDLFTTSGRMKVLQLKRFLLARLDSDYPAKSVEMLVKGSIVGNELSLTFIQRTMWLNDCSPIEIEYQFSDETL